MVNIPRIRCHSSLKHYEMYHWGCGDGDTYNTTYNFNGGSIFGGSFGGGFWNGVGMGLGAGIASLFGFGGGGCFGGGWNFGQNFFGTPQLTAPTRNFFGDYYGQYRHTGDGAGGQSTTTGGSSITSYNTTSSSNKNKDEKPINKLNRHVDKFLKKYAEGKYNGKGDKALIEAKALYGKCTLALKDDIETDDDNAKLQEIKDKLIKKFPQLKDDTSVQQQQELQVQAKQDTIQQAPEESFEDKVGKCKDFAELLALIGGNKYNELNKEDKAAFDAKFDELLNAIGSDKNALEQLKISVTDYGDLLSKVTAKISALEAAEEADEADDADDADDADETAIKPEAQAVCNQALNDIKMDNKGTVMKNATIDDLSTLGVNEGKGISIIDTSKNIPDFINKVVTNVDKNNKIITVIVNEAGYEIKYKLSPQKDEKTGALKFISNKAQQEYLLQKDDKGNIFLIQYNGMKGHNKGDLTDKTKNNDYFGI